MSVAAIAICGLTHQCAAGADASPIAVGMATFSNPDGVNYFALCLKAAPPPAAGPRDVVVLLNTSASQTGDYRVKVDRRAQGPLDGLEAERSRAVDGSGSNAVGLTKGFVAPDSKEMADALAALERACRWCATDMEKALTTAAGSFSGEAKSPRQSSTSATAAAAPTCWAPTRSPSWSRN